MDRERRILVYIIFNMALISVCLIAGYFFWREASGHIIEGVTYMSPINSENRITAGDSYSKPLNVTGVPLSTGEGPQEINEMLNRLGVIPYNMVGANSENDGAAGGMSWESRVSAKISGGGKSADVRLTYCDAGFLSIHPMNFIEGAPWLKSEDMEQIIILSEYLAWRLFGGVDVIGMTVIVGDEDRHYSYKVTGVVRRKGDGQSDLTAWLPAGSRLSPYSGFRPVAASGIYLMPRPYIPADARTDAINMLAGKPVSDYAIVDMDKYIESMHIRRQILLIMTIAFMAYTLMRQAGKIIPEGRLTVADIVKRAVALAGAAAAVWVIFSGIYDIVQWLPNLTDPDTPLMSILGNINALPPESVMPYGLSRISQLNRYANYAWIAGAGGLINLFFCLR